LRRGQEVTPPRERRGEPDARHDRKNARPTAEGRRGSECREQRCEPVQAWRAEEREAEKRKHAACAGPGEIRRVEGPGLSGTFPQTADDYPARESERREPQDVGRRHGEPEDRRRIDMRLNEERQKNARRRAEGELAERGSPRPRVEDRA